MEKLSKKVKVSDPEMWYGQKEVEVNLFVCPPFRDVVYVKLTVESIDDFMMEYYCDTYGESDTKTTYNRMKKYMYDKIPRKINCRWLLEHGFFPG